MASYHFECGKIDALEEIDVQLIENFKSIEEIDVQMQTRNGQKHAELNRNNSKLML